MELSQLQYIAPILKKVGEQNLPIKTAYKFIKLSKLIEPELEFYSTKLTSILQSYGEVDENGQLIQDGESFKLKQDCIDACQKDFTELNSIQIDIPIKFTLDELENVQLSVGELALLESFIEE